MTLIRSPTIEVTRKIHCFVKAKTILILWISLYNIFKRNYGRGVVSIRPLSLPCDNDPRIRGQFFNAIFGMELTHR